MLILTRKSRESIRIADDITITIMEVDGTHVRIGIDAPRDVEVYRSEIYEEARAARESERA